MTAQTNPQGAAEPDAHTMAQTRSTTTLLSDFVNQLTEIFRKEIQLFRAEVSQKVSDVGTALGLIVGGLVLALTAANALAAALIAALATLGIDGPWAAVIVGAVLGIIGYGLVSSGMKSLRASSLAPDRSAHSVQKDIQVVKESVR